MRTNKKQGESSRGFAKKRMEICKLVIMNNSDAYLEQNGILKFAISVISYKFVANGCLLKVVTEYK